jgi:isochorismate synthase
VFEDLGHSLRGALRSLDRRTGGGLISVCLPLPNIHLGPYLPIQTPGYYWGRSSSELTLLGTGIAARITGRGPRRLEDLSRTYAQMTSDWVRLGDENGPKPVAFLGFAFSPAEAPGPEWHGLENAELVVPELQYRRSRGRAWMTFTAGPGEHATAQALETRWLERLAALMSAQRRAATLATDAVVLTRVEDGDWNAPFDQALGDIHQGRLDKVVLTRKVRYTTSRPLSWGRVLDALEQGHENCARFAVARSGFALLGVSPERLVSLDRGVVVADALAGTAPRGATPALDATLAARLKQDPKALQEHRIVVEQIQTALEPCCRGLLAPQAPEIMSLPTVHHLWSPVGGHLRNGSDLLELAQRLHPTPAVGGSPRTAALDWLRTHERQGRGWYTGAFGWLDAEGSGELSVVLRCGTVDGTAVDLFAGAGIVADSRPDQEYAETEWKLCTMRGALELG